MIDPRLLTADQLGIRLEVVNGLSIWETQPLYKHQKAVERIAQSIRQIDESCECVHAMDVYVQFPMDLSDPIFRYFAGNRRKQSKKMY